MTINVFALYYSNDAENWKMARICYLDMKDEVMVGISAQSPIGDSCQVKHENLEITKNPSTDLRNAR